MKAAEIESFLAANGDLVVTNPNTEGGVVDYIVVDNIHEFIARLLASGEYKAYVERERWQRAKDIFSAKADADMIKGLALMPSELDKPEIKF